MLTILRRILAFVFTPTHFYGINRASSNTWPNKEQRPDPYQQERTECKGKSVDTVSANHNHGIISHVEYVQLLSPTTAINRPDSN